MLTLFRAGDHKRAKLFFKKKLGDDSFEIDLEARSCFPSGSLILHRKMVYVNYRRRI